MTLQFPALWLTAPTQQALALKVGVHVVQLRRYEAGSSQPTLDVIRHLAVALQVSADLLLFCENQRGPDDDLKGMAVPPSRLCGGWDRFQRFSPG